MKQMKPTILILFLVLFTLSLASSCSQKGEVPDVGEIDRERIVTAADLYLSEKPVTVTAASCQRSTGGLHDFYSEGDYWWLPIKLQGMKNMPRQH